MKYTNEVINAIIDLKIKNYSSRSIASALLISKSGVNQVYTRYLETLKGISDGYTKTGMRLLFIDLESSPDVAVSFKRFKTSYGQDNILQEGGSLLTIAWRWNDDPTTYGMALTPQEAKDGKDLRLVRTLWNLIEDADALCAHNLVQFDNALLNARLVINKLPPHKTVKMIDTLKIARSMKFQSNRLDSLGVALDVGAKTKHSGIKLWIDCMAGDQRALDEMLAYNKNDVDLLVAVYERLKSFDTKAPNAGLYTTVSENESVCRVCGSNHLEVTDKLIVTTNSTYNEVKCLDCGSRSRKRQAVNSKEQRKNLLVT